MALTQESVLTFLLARGGQVTNSELLKCFRGQINSCGSGDPDPAGKQQQHNRDAFKRLVNSVAVVKHIGDVKFVVVKKRYRDFVKGDAGSNALSAAEPNPPPPPSPPPLPLHRAAASAGGDDDLQNNPRLFYPLETTPCDHTNSPSSDNERSLVKVLSVSSSDHVGGTGAVFAVISVRSPPPPRPPVRPHRDLRSEWITPEKRPPVASLSRTAPPLNRLGPTLERRTTWSTGGGSQSCENLAELNGPGGDSPPTRGATGLMTSQSTIPRRADVDSVPLEPVGHEWLVKSAAGMWRHVHGLLLLDARLANRRDFMSGFTALHWAAKGGRGEMVRRIVDVSRSEGGTRVDVDRRTHGGYTPLHVAAIHGHGDVITLLVQSYGARVDLRDNAGKKAYHYLGTRGTADLKELLLCGGGRRDACRRQEEEEEDYRELPKGLNTISKLFQPHALGHRKKQRPQPPPGLPPWDGV
ncbi:hypothetical protein NHX12_011630 [Muraenolepis orangiensis]|uniref:SOWAHA-C winged helix-turn-helix domain-containing protein n=1 Tax=Muraenolepis orangiensis TaxID=630683 RepID=A0A9Q0DGR0_9TELE|nr:hypothetical protein NHX12_011630 [Muraenolepis orangiensis]